jgi:hypothetical protein
VGEVARRAAAAVAVAAVAGKVTVNQHSLIKSNTFRN